MTDAEKDIVGDVPEDAPDEPNAFIVSDGERLAKWVNGEINWVDDPMDATRFSRPCDASALSTGYYMWLVRKLYPDRDKVECAVSDRAEANLRAEVEGLTKERDELVEITADSIIEMASHAVSEKKVELSALLTRAEKAEAALWPFARINMVQYSVMASDDASIELSGFELIDGKAFIKASAFRNARASLTEGE